MKDRILSCSMGLFSRFGIKGLTMDGIAAELGMSKRTLYEHFSCKEELLTECLQLHLYNCKLFTPTADGLIDELLALYVGMQKINRSNAYRFCQELQKFYDPTYRMLLNQLFDYASVCSEKIQPGIDDGYIRRDVPANAVRMAVADYLIHLFFGTRADYKNIWEIYSPEIIVIFTRGLCSIKGRDYLDKKLKELAL